MKNVILAAIAAMTMSSTPAIASDFTGPRVEATAGYQNVTANQTNFTYGAEVGYDVKVLGPLRVGVETGVDNVFDRRNINVGARLGLKLTNSSLAYAKIDYANYRDINFTNVDGARFAGGVETKVIGPVFTTVEFRHQDFGGAKSNDVVTGLGVRF